MTFVSHFTAHPIQANVFKNHLSKWEDGVRRLSGTSLEKRMVEYIKSDGGHCTPEFAVIGNSADKVIAFGYEYSIILSGNRLVKTQMVVRLGENEFDGEIYITFVNFPHDNPVEKRFFSLRNILIGDVIKESTLFMWSNQSAPKILLGFSQLYWISKVINRQLLPETARNILFENVDRKNDAVECTAKKDAVENAAAECAVQIDAFESNIKSDAAECDAKTCATDNAAQTVPESSKEIARLKEQLEDYKSENEELAEKNEQLASKNRELKKEQKQLTQNIEDQKKRIKTLKKRAESAEARAKEAASGDVKEFCDHFDEELKRLENEGEEKDKLIEKLQQELDIANGKVTSLKGRLNKQNSGNGTAGLLATPENETEKYENEFGIAIFSALHKAIEKTPTKNNSPHTRCIDVWQAIIDANPDLEQAFEQFCDNKDALKNAIVSGELEKKKNFLKPFNLDFDRHTNNHPKITFGRDQRYIASMASTASETASGFSNGAKDLRNTFLYPT